MTTFRTSKVFRTSEGYSVHMCGVQVRACDVCAKNGRTRVEATKQCDYVLKGRREGKTLRWVSKWFNAWIERIVRLAVRQNDR